MATTVHKAMCGFLVRINLDLMNTWCRALSMFTDRGNWYQGDPSRQMRFQTYTGSHGKLSLTFDEDYLIDNIFVGEGKLSLLQY